MSTVQPETERRTTSAATQPRVLIDIHELSLRLTVPVATIYNWVYQRRVPFLKLGRCLRFDVLEIEEWLQRCTTMDEAGKR